MVVNLILLTIVFYVVACFIHGFNVIHGFNDDWLAVVLLILAIIMTFIVPSILVSFALIWIPIIVIVCTWHG